MSTDRGELSALLLTTQEVANLLGCGARTIWRWAHSGRMPAPIKIGDGRAGAVRFRRREIEEWIDAGCPRCDGGTAT